MVAVDRARKARLARDFLAARERCREVAAAIADEKEFMARMTSEHRDRLRELEQELVRANNNFSDIQAEITSINYRAEKALYRARKPVQSVVK